VIYTGNATGRHRGPKQKLRAGYRVSALKWMSYVSSCKGLYIFRHWL